MVKVDRKSRQYISWLDSPLVQEHYLKKLDGKSGRICATNWITWVKEKYVPIQLDYGISLGCADGGLERHAISIGICSHFDAYDISTESINIAKKLAQQSKLLDKINYYNNDLNNISLYKNKYDIAFASMSLHHISDLEHVFNELENSLKPNGLFIYNEYVGPDQFQWTEKQLKIMNDMLEILPKKYRRDLISGNLKEKIYKPSIEFMNGYDPSEAIHSSDIIPMTAKHFDIIERIDYGGTLLHILLQNIIGNFNPSKEEDIAIFKLLCYVEESLIREKVLSSDFSIIVTKNKK